MIVTKYKNTLVINSQSFRAKGHYFDITGTRLDEDGLYYVSVKNRTTGASSEIEHQNLCRLILQYGNTI